MRTFHDIVQQALSRTTNPQDAYDDVMWTFEVHEIYLEEGWD